METQKEQQGTKIGRYEVKQSIRGKNIDLFILNSLYFQAINWHLETADNIISAFNYPDSSRYAYHIKDCTINFFLNNDYVYFIIANENLKKRQQALKILEEVLK